jgi:hypothetical protein
MRMDERSLSAVLVALLGLTAGCDASDDGAEVTTAGAGTTEPAASTNDPAGTASQTSGVPSPAQTAAPPSAPSPAPTDTEAPPSPAATVEEPAASSPPPSPTPSAGGDEPEPVASIPMNGDDEPPDDAEPPPDETDPPSEPAPDGGAMPDEPNPPDDVDPPAEPGGEMFGPDIEGSCTESEPANSNASGTGPYDVVVETNSDSGINEGTIFRPATLGGDEVFPIFVWGQGGCSLNGLSNASAMAEIASHGYFVVADGTPNGGSSRSMDTNNVASMGEPLLAYVEWALAENSKPCSAYYHALDASKIAANGFSCGGLMSTGTAGDPRITTWGSTSSGTFSADQSLYDSVHTPVLIIEGGPSDIAYENGLRDYENISQTEHPIMFFSKDIGHGGDLFQGDGGDFTKINLAWLNWWLKGDESETGKGVLVGDGCSYCTDSEWEVMSANIP